MITPSPEQTPILITGKPAVDSQLCEFSVNRVFLPGHTYNCKDLSEASGSPLLEALFSIEGIEQVLVADNKVTVLKSSDEPWKTFGKKVGGAIRQTIESGVPYLSTDIIQLKKGSSWDEATSSVEEVLIQKILDDEINPSIAAHGGHVSLIEVKDHVAYVRLSGGCQGCSMSMVTLKEGIETQIKEKVPSIKEVADLTDHEKGTRPFYQ